MKKFALTALVALCTQAAWSAESAGLVGIMNTSGTVDVNGFANPKSIWTVYNVNDPSEEAVVLAYVAYRRVGKHQLSIEWTDAKGQAIDRCAYDPVHVSKLPWVHTITCKWGGRLPSGGINFTVFNTADGKKERVGEMFVPAKQ